MTSVPRKSSPCGWANYALKFLHILLVILWSFGIAKVSDYKSDYVIGTGLIIYYRLRSKK